MDFLHIFNCWLLTTEDGSSMTTFYYCFVNHQSGLQSNTSLKISHIKISCKLCHVPYYTYAMNSYTMVEVRLLILKELMRERDYSMGNQSLITHKFLNIRSPFHIQYFIVQTNTNSGTTWKLLWLIWQLYKYSRIW